MPIYEFMCPNCKNTLELLEDKETQAIITECLCGEDVLHYKILSATPGKVDGGTDNKLHFGKFKDLRK